MFHQANIIPAGDIGDGTQSLLDYWYERVMQDFSKWMTFPVKVGRTCVLNQTQRGGGFPSAAGA